MADKFINLEVAIKLLERHGLSNGGALGHHSGKCDLAAELLRSIPATDVEPVRHAFWVKRMEHGVGRDHEVYTPIWSCSNCDRDYDPASCTIIKYYYICGANMDGGQDG